MYSMGYSPGIPPVNDIISTIWFYLSHLISSLHLGHTHHTSLINHVTCMVNLNLSLVTRQNRPPDAFNTFTPRMAKASAAPSIHPTPAVFQQHLPQLHRCISSLSYFHFDELLYHAFTAACYQSH